MNRRLVLAASAVTLAGLAGLPAQAAAPKIKPFSGSYTVTLNPDPSSYTGDSPAAMGTGCNNTYEGAIDRHSLKIPGKGTLKVVLDSADPTRPTLAAAPAGLDWDLHILLDDGEKAAITGRPAEEELSSSQGATTHEQTDTRFAKATKIIIEVCNNIGTPGQSGKITYSFKP